MARQWVAYCNLLLCAFCVVQQAQAMPAVAFPFNSQVPTVARVGQQYSFQFSGSTFMPEGANFTYSLADGPAWLTVESDTRTLSGQPDLADAGSATFTLSAADEMGTAQMPCTIVVSSDPAPQLEGDITKQLAATTNLSSTEPPVITLMPLRTFNFHFEQTSFIDIVQRKLYYYATMADHTPLPSWVRFDPTSLSFSGMAPQLSAFPQSWSFELIASDVEGFAGTSVAFDVAIAVRQLVFVPQHQIFNFTPGSDIDIKRLGDTLFLNGAKVPLEVVTSAQASTPDWLTFDAETLSFTGRAPVNATDLNITVQATDLFGNEALAVVSLIAEDDSDDSLFVGQIGDLEAQSGQEFEYHLSDDLFATDDVDLQILLPATARWLKFDSSSRTLSGKVPRQTEASTIKATLSAQSKETRDSQKQSFSIDILPVTAVSSTQKVDPRTTSTPSASSTPKLVASEQATSGELSKGAIAGIVLGAVGAVAILAACLLLCCRRRKRHEGYVETNGQFRPSISRPILPLEPAAILVTREVENDVEKGMDERMPGIEESASEPPPQIALNLPNQSQNKRMKWSKRFSRISQVSSIGNGEEAIKGDTNIPELGQTSTTIHTPHDSFSVPTQIARSSRQLSDLSPSKQALKRLQRQRQSQQSIGLGIDTGGEILLPRHSSRAAHRRARSSLGMSTVVDASSIASMSTEGTGMLFTKASDFPQPCTRSTFGSRSTQAPAPGAADKRKSIRLVDRSDSIADNRSLQDKRQSFIRNRASTSFASPLFAHGSRLSSNPLQNGQNSQETSTAGSQRRSRRGKSQLTSYSQSSSLEPSLRSSRRLSARVRSTFAPSYPRPITRSTLGGADDERAGNRRDSSSGFETISSFTSGTEWRTEMTLPRKERNWVLPNEASPTPPPAPPASRHPSTSRRSSSKDSEPRQRLKDRFREHSQSPLSTAVAVPITDPRLMSATESTGQHRRNRLSEPISLVSNDSLNRSKLERPKLVQTNSKRPVSVEKVRRLSSLRAETDDARPGSEMWEAMEEAGLMPPNSRDGKEGTQRSNMSGPAFL